MQFPHDHARLRDHGVAEVKSRLSTGLSRINKNGNLRAADKNPPSFWPMKKDNLHSDDPRFNALLRQGRVSPPLPPGFRQGVWRRIEDSEAAPKPESWLDALAAMILRPRLAFATAAALLLAGVLLGTHEGSQAARQDAQARYLAAVAPNSLR
jgi:hypothetical protein